MDPIRFDTLTKSLGQARSRRTLLRTLGGAALGAVGLGSGRPVGAAPGGNSACAAFCHQVFGQTRAAGQCTSDAAHGRGLCYQCGPAAQGTGLTLCGTTCTSSPRCGDAPAYYQDRFQYCMTDVYQNCADCAGWMGCYGSLDTGTSCGTVTVPCG